MEKILITLRIPEEILKEIDARARQLNMNRTKYMTQTCITEIKQQILSSSTQDYAQEIKQLQINYQKLVEEVSKLKKLQNKTTTKKITSKRNYTLENATKNIPKENTKIQKFLNKMLPTHQEIYKKIIILLQNGSITRRTLAANLNRRTDKLTPKLKQLEEAEIIRMYPTPNSNKDITIELLK